MMHAIPRRFRNTWLGVLLALTGCATPGIVIDNSGMGNSPIAKEARRMINVSDDTRAGRFMETWFEKRCPARGVEAAVLCASEVGMTCQEANPVNPDARRCNYTGYYRTPQSTSPENPETDSRAWRTVEIRVVLDFGSNSGLYNGLRITYAREVVTNTKGS